MLLIITNKPWLRQSLPLICTAQENIARVQNSGFWCCKSKLSAERISKTERYSYPRSMANDHLSGISHNTQNNTGWASVPGKRECWFLKITFEARIDWEFPSTSKGTVNLLSKRKYEVWRRRGKLTTQWATKHATCNRWGENHQNPTKYLVGQFTKYENAVWDGCRTEGYKWDG